MLLLLLAAMAVGDPPPLPDRPKILFLGNSHTQSHNIPRLVKGLLESDGSGRKVETAFVFGSSTDTLWANQSTRKRVQLGEWDVVVIQGQPLSMSRKYIYSQDATVGFAKLARASGARPILFAEWPRRGIDEVGYIKKIYGRVTDRCDAEVAPVVDVFGEILKTSPKMELWAGDGNHSSKQGAFAAACVIYHQLLGKEEPRQIPSSVEGIKRGDLIYNAALRTVSATILH
jgi:hypothetical protein